MSTSIGGQNGPAIVNGGANSYDRALDFDAPVAFDSGLVVQQGATRAQLRDRLMIRLGFASMRANPPPGMVDTCNEFLRTAQEHAYWRYPVLRTENWWSWQLSPGMRFYDLPINGIAVLEPRRVSAAWIADTGGLTFLPWTATVALALGALVLPSTATGYVYKVTVAGTTAAAEPAWPTAAGGTVVSGSVTFTAIEAPAATWTPVAFGINAAEFTASQTGKPHRLEVREYIEVWPAPDKTYLLQLKGHMGLLPFDDDANLVTIDAEVVLTFATALAKAHYRQPDANNYAQMAAGLERNLTAGTHAGRRYLPQPATGGLKGAHTPLLPLPIGTWRG